MKLNLLHALAASACLMGAAPANAQTPAISVPAFRLTEQASVWDNLPSAVATEVLLPLDTIVNKPANAIYRTRLNQANADSVEWEINRLDGTAYFYVEGEYVGKVQGNGEVCHMKMPPMEASMAVEIFLLSPRDRVGRGVEGIGVNSGDTAFISPGNGWRIYPIPTDYATAAGREFSTDAVPVGPAFYRGSFNIEQPGNTYLDLSAWDTGILYLNGKEAGRYSPEANSVAIEASALRPGANEVILLDVSGAAGKPVLQAYASPRSAGYTVGGKRVTMNNAPAGLDAELIVAEGAFTPGKAEIEVALGRPVNSRYVAVELLDGPASGEAALAEVRLIGPGIHSQNRDRWVAGTMTADDNAPANTPDKAIDMDSATFWRSAPGKGYPHALLIDMGENNSITSVTLVPAAGTNARPGKYRIYAF